MPQSVNQTIRTTFNKGLLTEFSELNFPQEASVDELNCDLFKAGYRTKRYGLEEQTGSEAIEVDGSEGSLFHIQKWTNVGEDSSVNFVVVQERHILRFFKIGESPLTEGIVYEDFDSSVVYELDMSEYNYSGGFGAGYSRISAASINGYLVVVSPQIEPFVVFRDPDTGEFSHEQIDFYIRDYEWQGDRSEYDGRESDPDVYRKYDTKNCGWADGDGSRGDNALSTYRSKRGAWPPLTHPWFSGKDSDGDFSSDAFSDVYAGSSLTGNGHYVLSLFSKDRATASGLSDLEAETLDARFSTVAAYAGRVWYSGADSRVYYSQILEGSDQLGSCYASNDPTSEYSSDSLETDGGYITISAAEGIKGLVVFGSSLLVFANNGVWRISGTDYNLFSATSYSVYKITDYGLAYRASLVSGQNGVPFWWSYSGIHTIEVTNEGGMIEQSISRDTIQTFWDDIGTEAKGFVTAAFDKDNNRIAWLYPDEDEEVDYKLNNILFLDVDLGAFFPWRVEDASEDTPYVVGATFLDGQGNEEVEFDVVDSSGNYVVDSSGSQVVVTREVGTLKSSELVYLTYDNGGIYFSVFTSNTYTDWGDNYYDAYAESSYNFIGDLGRRKNSPYITVLMRTTETGWSVSDGIYSLEDASSLFVSAYWDFKSLSSTAPQQAYRLKNPPFVDPDDLDTFTHPTSVITTRLRLRGRGRVVKLRFEGEDGKGFTLLGWETVDAVNPGY